jgi:hypothetical protein
LGGDGRAEAANVPRSDCSSHRANTLDTYGHVFDELDGAERISAEQAIRKARAEARATLVRPAPERVAQKKNETPRVAGLS